MRKELHAQHNGVILYVHLVKNGELINAERGKRILVQEIVLSTITIHSERRRDDKTASMWKMNILWRKVKRIEGDKDYLGMGKIKVART